MATPAHCAFCFQVLAASFEQCETTSLRRVQELWSRYKGAPSSESDTTDDDLMAVEDEPDDDVAGDDERRARQARLRAPLSSGLLAVPSPASGTSSSASSTPSSMSTSSSRTPASTLGTSSSNSSRSLLLSHLQPPRRPSPLVEPDRPLFVTWSTIGRSERKSLRGCIGTFDPQPIEAGLRSYALTSALDDSRFMPITKRELRTLEVGVTLLKDFETASSPTSWTLGRHGIRISFSSPSGRYGATYLPNVPIDQGWTKEETLISLMRKAGWTGRSDDWRKVTNLKVVRYQGKKATLTYEEWLSWRRWTEESDQDLT